MGKAIIRTLRFDAFTEQRLYNKDECCVRRTMTKTRYAGFVNDTRVDIYFNPNDNKVLVRMDRNAVSVSNIITAKINAEYKRMYNVDITVVGEYTLYTFNNVNDPEV